MAEPAADGTGVAEKPPVSNLNIANALTVLRIALVPLFAWVLLMDDGQDTTLRVVAFVVFALAMITDRIDGEIARSRGLVTNFGKIADPIADKALTGMAFVGLSIIGVLWWWVTIVVLVREWGITLMRFVVIRYGVMPASRGGKIKTTLQSVALGGYLLPFELWGGTLSTILLWVTHVAMVLAVVVTVVTAVDYVMQAVRMRREARAAA
ncbi:CDP-diacylglycerol--glycerol-3-phosphate 3-phosphatidyltransferase [Solicola sp. PLA-1-18]|jgi:CDP-diacylglycerol--glycerol-3-phosphate 3-phosphatidyltransferase|uniref:CDP-diacylglycerol--glycerol-3-phosphate 3-phosphatidyltransferase n=1 Tax=Solicola sp. PLA-1-18 TaxID=3380532 RepID=UPI003B7689CE